MAYIFRSLSQSQGTPSIPPIGARQSYKAAVWEIISN